MNINYSLARLAATAALLALASAWAFAAEETRTLDINGTQREYILHVPDNAGEIAPLVLSLHGAAGHDTDRSPMRADVADKEGFIVAYPQGLNQNFGPFGTVPGWDATGQANIDLDFFKAIIEDVAEAHSIDRSRIYCCGFSNGGMMTYSNATSVADIFAAFASISGFQLNEFHHRPTGARPVPFMHIHGKADDFVKYSCMPIIRDAMVARNGCNPVPVVTEKAGKYTYSVYEAGEGGFPYVYYEMDGMWHADFTDNTPEGSSAQTMWNFMSQYSLNDACDKSLKWRLNPDTEGYNPKEHNWKVSADGTRYEFGRPGAANNADNNVYPSVQFEQGSYVLRMESEGQAGDKIYVQLESLDGSAVLFCIAGEVGEAVVMPFEVPAYEQYKLTIVKENTSDKLTAFAFHSTDEPDEAQYCVEATLPEEQETPETGYLIEIPQDQGKTLDDFSRTAFTAGDEYNTYTATADLQIAFKMVNVDVIDCDYILIKYAEPVAAGWHLSFWTGQDLTDLPEGSTEYKFELTYDMMDSGIIPQITMMTFFGGYSSPLVAKVEGVYKHCTLDAPDGIASVSASEPIPVAYYTTSGAKTANPAGLTIARMSDGSARKILIKK